MLAVNLVADPIFFFPAFYTLREWMHTRTLSVETFRVALGNYRDGFREDLRNTWAVWFPGHMVTFGALVAATRATPAAVPAPARRTGGRRSKLTPCAVASPTTPTAARAACSPTLNPLPLPLPRRRRRCVVAGVVPPHLRMPWVAALSFSYMVVLSMTRGAYRPSADVQARLPDTQ